MTRLTFGILVSPFTANMAMRQNALYHHMNFPLTGKSIMDSFYVDDSLGWADSVEEAIKLRTEMQKLFKPGGFVLRKWKSSEPAVLAQKPPELIERDSTQSIDIDQFSKVLGMERNTISDSF